MQEADWFRKMLQTHLAAMRTVQQLTSGRGMDSIWNLVNHKHFCIQNRRNGLDSDAS